MAERPTQFDELNGILRDFVGGAQAALGDTFVGAYLVGSFALGDATDHSDVDFLVVTAGSIQPEAEARLRSLHRELPEQDNYWARHLEGAYSPRDELRRIEETPTKWLYVDTGSREMEWSDHFNTAVVRSTLRERGLILTGPDPRGLVEPVSPASLRAEARVMARHYLEWIERQTSILDHAWRQPYLVATFSRILATLHTARVFTKREALMWARHNLGVEWHALIDNAAEDRRISYEEGGGSARPGASDMTLQFARFANELARRSVVGEPGFEPGTGRI